MAWTLPSPTRGVWVKIPAVEVIEVLASAGVDFVVIDREHGAIDLREMTTMIAVGRGLGLPVFVRVPGHATELVQPALDAGATGLFIPHVEDAETAKAVVDACRFPPMGHRTGSLTTRMGTWGAESPAELVRRGNEELMLVAQIEDPQGVGNVEEIIAVPGLDAVFIGPFDLALSSGLSATSPEFGDMVAAVEKAALGRRALGGVAANAKAAADMLTSGYSFVMVGADVSLLASSARSLSNGVTA
ncbi:aldolase/citrate lyase family protein [Streptomyces sp. NPDC013178]|uniref:HpcH/HpaI aldolase family protein n=1 Tax=Streptomyces sp. NPDC013178 TaxID=3155118 RepID=UPI0033EAA6EA